MRIKYNAPTTLTYAFFCTLVVALDTFFLNTLTRAFFTVPAYNSFDLTLPLNYLRLFTHIAGHADWNHLVSNLAYLLLLGPMLEETYGSFTMFLMIIVTGFVTGVLNVCFFPQPLLGASGVVFMMILLASFTNNGKDDVPLTFILIVFLYLGREILNVIRDDDISQFAHLAGGLCGSLFGFFRPGRRQVSALSSYARVPSKTDDPDKTLISAPQRKPAAARAPAAASSRSTAAARVPAAASSRSPAAASSNTRAPASARAPAKATPAADAATPRKKPAARQPAESNAKSGTPAAARKPASKAGSPAPAKNGVRLKNGK